MVRGASKRTAVFSRPRLALSRSPTLPAHPPQAGAYGFRIGTFNIFPSFAVTTLMITAMGVLPYYVKYGMSGEQPRVKDDFERYQQQQHYWDTVRGAGGEGA